MTFRAKLIQDFKLPDIDDLTLEKKIFASEFQEKVSADGYLIDKGDTPVYFDSSKLNQYVSFANFISGQGLKIEL